MTNTTFEQALTEEIVNALNSNEVQKKLQQAWNMLGSKKEELVKMCGGDEIKAKKIFADFFFNGLPEMMK